MITREQALALEHWQELHAEPCTKNTGPKGGIYFSIEVWRVNGKVQTWKRRPTAFRVPLRHGLYDYGELTELNSEQFHLSSECPVNGASGDVRQ